MSKIKKITVSNLKAVSSLTADFNGCTAIITGGNNKGKTTFLRGIIDRIMGVKPELVLKTGESDGFAECELTTGEVFKWSFENKTKAGEKLTFITKDNIKTSLTRSIADRFFPPTFDVDKFLNNGPKNQRKTLQEIVGLDFSDIDSRYDIAFTSRTDKNRQYSEEKIKFDSIPVPVKKESVDISALIEEKENEKNRLNKLYLENKAENKKLRDEWKIEFDKARSDFELAKKDMDEKNSLISKASNLSSLLSGIGFPGAEVENWIKTLPFIKEVHEKEVKEPEYCQELPDDSGIKDIDEKINSANTQNIEAENFNNWSKKKVELSELYQKSIDANELIKSIEKERMDLIKSAKMPEGFSFTDSGITYNGFNFTKEQLSSSGLYIAALKLAETGLGEVRTLHFDASFLDKNSLMEIEKWANGNDLQLLIERPDWEGGEIEYQIIEKL